MSKERWHPAWLGYKMLLPLANPLFPVKPGLSSTNTGRGWPRRLQGCWDSSSSDHGEGRKWHSLSKILLLPRVGQVMKVRSSQHNLSKKKRKIWPGRTLTSHTPAQTLFTASMDFWDIIRISCQFPLCKSYENLCRHTGEGRKCGYKHPETLEL